MIINAFSTPPILALSHKAIKKYLERVSRFKPFIDKYT